MRERSPWMAVLATSALWLASCAGAPTPQPVVPDADTPGAGVSLRAPKRVLLVTIDTLRADYVGSYGTTLAKTPTLDRIAREGVRFATAISPAPITMPSHASLMTALDPPAHGVHANGKFRLPDSIPTLAEQFQRAGFATAGFVAAVVLDHRYGLARGFDHYDDQMGYRRNIRGETGAYAERTADQMVDAVLAWLDTAPENFFVWVHFYDPHGNYDPPRGFRPKHIPTPEHPDRAGVLELASLMFPPLYAGEIYFTDTELGRLLRVVGNRYRDDDTLVVVTSDHGESLGEHGEVTHALTVYDATQKVPLLMQGAGLPSGRVVESPVRLIDVAPTILDHAGLPALPKSGGVSLLPWVRGDRNDPISAYVETLETYLGYGWSPVLGLRTDRYKYLRTVRPELYDLTADPHELDDISSANAETTAEMDKILTGLLRDARPVEPEEIGPSQHAALLESLGYVVGDAGKPAKPVGWVGGRDPKDAIGGFVRLLEARSQLAQGHAERAREILADEPEAGGWVAQARAEIALELGDGAEAERNARIMIDAQPQHATGYIALGQALEMLGRQPEAVHAYREATRVDPNETSSLVALGRLAEAEGRTDAAIADYQHALDSNAPNADAALRLAALYYEQGKNAQAEELLRNFDDGGAEAISRLVRAQSAAGFPQIAESRLTRALKRDPGNTELRALSDEVGDSR
jgi:choline-sulfatase